MKTSYRTVKITGQGEHAFQPILMWLQDNRNRTQDERRGIVTSLGEIVRATNEPQKPKARHQAMSLTMQDEAYG